MRLVFAAAHLAIALALCAALSAVAAHGAAQSDGALPEPFDATAMDRHVNGCTDFFAHATAAYRAAHPIPPEYSEYGYIEALVDRTRDIVHNIVVHAQREPGADENARKIGAFYSSCMDTATIERRGLAPLGPVFAHITAVVRSSDLPAAFAYLQALGVDAGFALNAAPDIRESAKIIAEIDQGGIGLPERDYYLRGDADSRKLRRQYSTHVAKMLQLGGDATAVTDAEAIIALETRFARAAKPVADLREPEATYHPMTASAVFALAPHAEFGRYLRALDISGGRVNVAEPAFLHAFDRALIETPLATWKNYLRWRVLDSRSTNASSPARRRNCRAGNAALTPPTFCWAKPSAKLMSPPLFRRPQKPAPSP